MAHCPNCGKDHPEMTENDALAIIVTKALIEAVDPIGIKLAAAVYARQAEPEFERTYNALIDLLNASPLNNGQMMMILGVLLVSKAQIYGAFNADEPTKNAEKVAFDHAYDIIKRAVQATPPQ